MSWETSPPTGPGFNAQYSDAALSLSDSYLPQSSSFMTNYFNQPVPHTYNPPPPHHHHLFGAMDSGTINAAINSNTMNNTMNTGSNPMKNTMNNGSNTMNTMNSVIPLSNSAVANAMPKLIYNVKVETAPIVKMELQNAFVSLLDGLIPLHDLQMSHRDIRPANVLMTDCSDPYESRRIKCRLGNVDSNKNLPYLSMKLAGFTPPALLALYGERSLQPPTQDACM
eukprot:gene32327-41889_t